MIGAIQIFHHCMPIHQNGDLQTVNSSASRAEWGRNIFIDEVDSTGKDDVLKYFINNRMGRKI